MIKLLIGGSPCTYWSIAQKNNRETKAEGLGWELFKNYLIAKEKFKPDFFLYENNKSASQAIKDQIKKELKVWDGTLFMEDSGARYIEINSALVSAQNRQRFYVHNCGEVEQPEDRGILLKDILESGGNLMQGDKSFALTTRCVGAIPEDTIQKHRHTMVAEPVENVGNCETIQKAIPKLIDKYGYLPEQFNAYNLAEITDKSPTLSTGSLVTSSCATTIFEKTDKPIYEVKDGKRRTIKAQYQNSSIANFITNGKHQATGVAEVIRIPPYGNDDKSRPVRACYAYKGAGVGSLQSECFPGNPNKQVSDYIAEPVRVGALPCPNGELSTSAGMRIYNADGKSRCSIANGGGQGAKTGLYAIPTDKPIYEVKDGKITIKGKQYPIKLTDGYYIIRKLTVTECCRLQTMPDDYCRAVSNAQAYKGLGNGWTAEVIIHILNGALKSVPKDEEIIVLSMYDGIGTGRYCLDKMGFTNVKYYAYEIDKYAKQIAMSNYPDIIQMGDAFDLRKDEWGLY